MNPITDKQAELLLFCAEFHAENDQLPTARAIAERFGWKSANGSYQMMETLRRKGYLARNTLGRYKFTALARAYITQQATVAS